jgi:hypothetical protein
MAVAAASQPWRWYTASLPITQARRRVSQGQVNAYPRRRRRHGLAFYEGSLLRALLQHRDRTETLLQGEVPRRLAVYAILISLWEHFASRSGLGDSRRDNLGWLR